MEVHHYQGGKGSKGFGWFPHNKYLGYCYVGVEQPRYAEIAAI
jgi:hypothetical protein